MWEVEPEGLEYLLVEGDGLLLAGFMFNKREMAVELPPLFIIDIVPAEPEEVADSKRRTRRHDDHGIVTILASEEEVVGEVLKLLFVADRFGSSSHDITLLCSRGSSEHSGQRSKCNTFNRLQPL